MPLQECYSFYSIIFLPGVQQPRPAGDAALPDPPGELVELRREVLHEEPRGEVDAALGAVGEGGRVRVHPASAVSLVVVVVAAAPQVHLNLGEASGKVTVTVMLVNVTIKTIFFKKSFKK